MAVFINNTNNGPSVVWTHLNQRNLWKAYEPDLCHHIENAFSAGQSKVFLGFVAPSTNLAAYDIDFGSMKQIHISTGKECPVQRTVLRQSSPLSKDVVWEFEGDKPMSWVTFDLETMQIIEDAFTQHTLNGNVSSPVLDMRQGPSPQPYLIDIHQMTQTRIETRKVRKIQRRTLAQSYPLDTSAASSSSTTGQGSTLSFQPVAPSTSPAKSISRQSSRRHRAAPYSTAIPKTLNGQGGGGVSQAQSIAALAQAKVLSHMQQLNGSSSNVIPLPQHNQISQQQTTNSMQWQTSYPTAQAQAGPSSTNSLQTLVPNQTFPNPLSHILGFGTSSSGMLQTTNSQASSQSSSQSYSVSGSNGITESLPTESHIILPKMKKKSKAKSKSGENALSSYMQPITEGLELTDCAICFDKLSTVSAYGEDHPEGHVAISLSKCGHQFHKLCLLKMHETIHKDSSLQCPSCKTIYGEKTGNCPPGTMSWRLMSGFHLPGHEDCDTICVSYDIQSGTQGPEHPHPGKRFSVRGFPRTGYIPDCNKGRKLLKLLILAFKRRLMFTIGTSITTGESGTVTWNEIHHKTEPQGNRSGHGFPDPNYMDNAILELSAHGVTEDCLT